MTQRNPLPKGKASVWCSRPEEWGIILLIGAGTEEEAPGLEPHLLSLLGREGMDRLDWRGRWLSALTPSPTGSTRTSTFLKVGNEPPCTLSLQTEGI